MIQAGKVLVWCAVIRWLSAYRYAGATYLPECRNRQGYTAAGRGRCCNSQSFYTDAADPAPYFAAFVPPGVRFPQRFFE